MKGGTLLIKTTENFNPLMVFLTTASRFCLLLLPGIDPWSVLLAGIDPGSVLTDPGSIPGSSKKGCDSGYCTVATDSRLGGL